MPNPQAEARRASAGGPDSAHDEGRHEPVAIQTWLIPQEGDNWCALAQDFDVVGLGPTPEAAIANMDELLLDYLELIQAEGGSIEDALRPISALRLLRLHAGRLWGNLLDAIHKVRHVQRLPHETHCLAGQ